MTLINPFLAINLNVAQIDQIVGDTTTAFQENELDPGPYINDIWDIHYETDQHKVQMPIASDSVSQCSYAVLAQPTQIRVVKFTMERSGPVGVYPLVPSPNSPDQNEVLKWGKLVLRGLTTEADGVSLNWLISGEYRYIVLDWSKMKVRAGASPTLGIQYEATEIPMSNFVNGLTAPLTGGGSVSIMMT